MARGNQYKKIDPPFGRRVVPIYSVGMKHLRLLVRKCPSLFGRVARPLFRKKGVSGCFPLVSFLCRSKGKYTKEQSISAKPHSMSFKHKLTSHREMRPAGRLFVLHLFRELIARTLTFCDGQTYPTDEWTCGQR